MLSLNAVKRLAHTVPHCNFSLEFAFEHFLLLLFNLALLIELPFFGLAFFCYLDQAEFCIQSQYYSVLNVVRQTHIYYILHSVLEANVFSSDRSDDLYLLVGVVQPIES